MSLAQEDVLLEWFERDQHGGSFESKSDPFCRPTLRVHPYHSFWLRQSRV